VSSGTIAILAVIVVLFIILVVYLSIRTHKKHVSAGKEDLVGKTALVEIALEPKGIVQVEGERWTAIIDSGRAEPEEEVIINKVEGLKLRVSKK
jgi:membrane-bound serine protease (ClpP class)